MDQCVGGCDYLGVCPGGFISWEGGYLRTCYHVILFSSLSGIGYRCVCVCVYRWDKSVCRWYISFVRLSECIAVWGVCICICGYQHMEGVMYPWVYVNLCVGLNGVFPCVRNVYICPWYTVKMSISIWDVEGMCIFVSEWSVSVCVSVSACLHICVGLHFSSSAGPRHCKSINSTWFCQFWQLTSTWRQIWPQRILSKDTWAYNFLLPRVRCYNNQKKMSF